MLVLSHVSLSLMVNTSPVCELVNVWVITRCLRHVTQRARSLSHVKQPGSASGERAGRVDGIKSVRSDLQALSAKMGGLGMTPFILSLVCS